MALYERILGLEEPKIPIHAFSALLGELDRGKVTQTEVASIFGLDVLAQADLSGLVAQYEQPLESISVGGFVTLTNIGTTYDAISASQGLGWFRIQARGISGFEFQVNVNKVGSGIQSWQLWNETTANEITVIDDAGAVGIKTLSTILTFPSSLAAGVRSVRVRAKSTVAADDPLYFGASVLIKRADRLTVDEIDYVLRLAETGLKYGSVADLKARFGVV